jgi:asparagine synthetase B (glutamine-hydrolysing)
MCGIAGIVSLLGKPVLEQELRDMCMEMVHRGPGVDPYMRHLSSIDVAAMHQPVSNEDGFVRVVFNAEIYKFRGLQPDLQARGHVFAKRSETAIGSLLSGGIDFSAVVAPEAQLSAHPLETVSVGLEKSEFNESRYARQVATSFGYAVA